MKTARKHDDLLRDGVATYPEAAELLRVSPRTIRRMVDARELPRTRVRGEPRIPRAAITDYLASHVIEATR
jgi:excisionase family DNA binding protein